LPRAITTGEFHMRTFRYGTAVLAAIATAALVLPLTACAESGSGLKTSGPATVGSVQTPAPEQSAQSNTAAAR
jgi:hypothetical protein